MLNCCIEQKIKREQQPEHEIEGVEVRRAFKSTQKSTVGESSDEDEFFDAQEDEAADAGNGNNTSLIVSKDN